MKKINKSNGKKKAGADYLGMVCVVLIAAILLGWLVFQSHELELRLQTYEARAVAVEEAIEEQKARTEQIDQLRAYMKTDAYAEDVARDKLGLVKENEIIFVEEEN